MSMEEDQVSYRDTTGLVLQAILGAHLALLSIIESRPFGGPPSSVPFYRDTGQHDGVLGPSYC